MKIPKISQEQITQHLKTGTVFQQQVWQALLTIPKGQTRSYKQLAISVGKPTAVRAVASAIAANTLYYQIPCHRVIRSNGEIGEYRWGKELKAELLKLEIRN
jgi:AraC family transcriptional regulator of adaptative response/methylated-DNA-[protein]-cysteine methyltransferase